MHRSGAGLAPESDLTHNALTEGSQASVQSRRGETAEEKKARKGAIKEGNVRASPLCLASSPSYNSTKVSAINRVLFIPTESYIP